MLINKSTSIIDNLKVAFYKVINEKWPNIINIEQINIFCSKNNHHGHFFSNIALILNKLVTNVHHENVAVYLKTELFKNNLWFAQIIIDQGFINLTLTNQVLYSVINQFHHDGLFNINVTKPLAYNVEFVSANPTGLLHVGHARNAVYGDVVSNILKQAGHTVIKEYYVNDFGNQIQNLTESVWKSYCDIFQKPCDIDKTYLGDEINDVAKFITGIYGDTLLSYDLPSLTDKKLNQLNPYLFKIDWTTDIKITDLIRSIAVGYLLDRIKKDLVDYGVFFDVWTNESSFYSNHKIEQMITIFKANEQIEFVDGAWWLKTKQLGDEKNRVLIKSDGTYTYLLPDIVYHVDKLNRSVDRLINIWGADHHDYARRMKQSLAVVGHHNILDIVLMQMVRISKAGEDFKMSKRSGTSITLRYVLDLLGKDALRFFLIAQPADTHFELNLDALAEKNMSNDFYYVQYVYARCHQLIKKSGLAIDTIMAVNSFEDLNLPHEALLAKHLIYFNEVFKKSVESFKPHLLSNYLHELSRYFHSYYATTKIIDPLHPKLMLQKLALILVVKHTVKIILQNIFGIEPLEHI